MLARKGRLSKGRPLSFSQRPKAEREWCRGAEGRERALRQCVIGVGVRGQKGGGMKGGRVLSGHIVVPMHKALCNPLHTFRAQGFMEAMEWAFFGSNLMTPVISQIL